MQADSKRLPVHKAACSAVLAVPTRRGGCIGVDLLEWFNQPTCRAARQPANDTKTNVSRSPGPLLARIDSAAAGAHNADRGRSQSSLHLRAQTGPARRWRHMMHIPLVGAVGPPAATGARAAGLNWLSRSGTNALGCVPRTGAGIHWQVRPPPPPCQLSTLSLPRSLAQSFSPLSSLPPCIPTRFVFSVGWPLKVAQSRQPEARTVAGSLTISESQARA